MPRRTALALVVLALALAGTGCARKAWIYEKPNVTPVRQDADRAECRKAATVRGGFAITSDDRVDLKLFQSCMAKKGYTARQEEE